MSLYDDNDYKEARAKAIQRSFGACQFCGRKRATEAHHWALAYPKRGTHKPDHLTALCAECHELATRIRMADRAGVNLRPIMLCKSAGSVL